MRRAVWHDAGLDSEASAVHVSLVPISLMRINERRAERIRKAMASLHAVSDVTSVMCPVRPRSACKAKAQSRPPESCEVNTCVGRARETIIREPSLFRLVK